MGFDNNYCILCNETCNLCNFTDGCIAGKCKENRLNLENNQRCDCPLNTDIDHLTEG